MASFKPTQLHSKRKQIIVIACECYVSYKASHLHASLTLFFMYTCLVMSKIKQNEPCVPVYSPIHAFERYVRTYIRVKQPVVPLKFIPVQVTHDQLTNDQTYQ